MSPVLKEHLYLKTASIQRPVVLLGLLYLGDNVFNNHLFIFKDDL